MKRWIGVVACLAFATATSAQTVGDADALYESRDVMAARASYRSAIDSGGLAPAELARAHRRLGIIAAVTGDLETAKAEFRRSLAIEPDAPAPADLAPDQRAEFEGLAAEASPVTVTLAEERNAGTVVLTATVDGADALGARGRVLWNGERLEEVELSGADFGTDLAREVAVVALDDHGNVAARSRGRVERPVVEEPLGAASAGEAPVPGQDFPEEGEGEAAAPSGGLSRGFKIAIAVAAVLVAGAIAAGVIWATRTENPSYRCCEIGGR